MRRPVRADVTASYDLGVEGYTRWWSAVILPPALAVAGELGLTPGARVLDVGGGTGAVIPTLRELSPGARIVAFDASSAMLRAALARTGATGVRCDAQMLPVRDGTADAVLLAYVLFHLEDPDLAVAEAARVLRDGGHAGSVTWAFEEPIAAFPVWDAALTAAGAPPIPSRGVHEGLDTPDAIDDLYRRGGLRPRRIWRYPLRHQWTAETYLGLATGSGMNRIRLRSLDADARAAVLEEVRERFAPLPREDFVWSGEVICAVATKP